MLLILILDVVYWIVVVAGVTIGLAWKGPRRIRALVFVGSVIVLALGLPVSSMLWPFDWLLPVSTMRAEAKLDGNVVRYWQKPGDDFYLDTLEIKGTGGKTATIYTNVDNGKCWYGWVETSDGAVTFNCLPWGKMATIEASWLDREMAECRRDVCDLSEAYFARR